MSKRVKITVYLDAADADVLRQIASDDVRTLPKYCEAQLVKLARANKIHVVGRENVAGRENIQHSEAGSELNIHGQQAKKLGF